MSNLSLLLLILGASFVLAEFQEENGVVILTNDNYEEATKQFPHLLVFVYSDKCGHCARLKPQWAKLVESYKGEYKLAKLDAVAHDDAYKKVGGGRGYPQLLAYYGKPQPATYEGNRQAEDIENFLNLYTGPDVQVVETAEELQAVRAKFQVVVGYFGNENQIGVFNNYAVNQRKWVKFVKSSKTELAPELGEGDRVVVYTQYEGRESLVLKGAVTQQSLDAFVNDNTFPLVSNYNKRDQIVTNARKQSMIFLTVNKEGTAQEEIFRELAKQYQGKIRFMFLNNALPKDQFYVQYSGLSQQFKLTYPGVYLMDKQKNAKHLYNQEDFSAEAIKKFLDQWLAGELEPWIKTQAPPATNDEPVKVIVGSTYQSLVADHDKDVLLEFYAPWCGHCKKLAPDYEALAKKVAYNTNLIIAKIDATENEVAGIQVGSYPTIKFIKKGGTRPQVLHYNGERTVEGFEQWLRKNVSRPWPEEPSESKEEAKQDL